MRRPSTVILLLLLSTAACLAQSGTNYISRRTYFRPDVSYQDITYYDGLGYTAAEVQVDAGGSDGNVITPYELDAMRRLDAKAYLPYPSASSSYDAGAAATQQAWYQGRFGAGQTRNYTNPQYVEKAYYYDPYGRVLQIVEHNAQNGTTRSSWNYDMAGTVISSHTSVTMGSASKSVLKAYGQDARGRIISEQTYIDGDTSPVTSVIYSYDALGRQNAVEEGNFVQIRHYDLRGWTEHTESLTGDTDIFTEYLRYESPAYTSPSYTGNVTERLWLQGDLTPQIYSYSYDRFGRLTSSTITRGGQPYNEFTERDITYDRNGNILSLKRYGSSSSTPSDNLAYTYNGNRIASLNGHSYSHDANGNVTADGYHGTTTSYNLVNLPCSVQNLESSLYYSYLIDGTKVAVTSGNGTGYAYSGDMVFSRSASGTYTFESMAYGNGRIEGSSNTVRQYVTDHLGNVRAVVTNGNVVERNDYYPFGGRHSRSTLPVLSTNRWRLGAKETQPSATGSIVDFGARMYDPSTGRWTTQDPMAWKYPGMSPYNYCGNDPINFVDSEGSEYSITVDKKNRLLIINATYLVNKNDNSALSDAISNYNNRKNDKYYIEGKTYSIKYNLSKEPIIGSPVDYTRLRQYKNANTYEVKSDVKGHNHLNFTTSGTTTNNKAVQIQTKYQHDVGTIMHEIGHTLHFVPNFSHSGHGIMTENHNSPYRTLDVIQENIDNMVEYKLKH